MSDLTYDGTLFDFECKKYEVDMVKKIKSIEDDIIPKNPNLIKSRKATPKKRIFEEKRESSSDVIAYTYDGIVDPFLNSLHLIKYYRSVLSYLGGSDIVFAPYNEDTPYAAKILDVLVENSRSDKIFLNSWIRYFYDYKLKGEKSKKVKYTSLMKFLETFDEYNSRHISA
jgi:hypothetical protein